MTTNTVKPIKPIRRGVERTTLGAGVLILLGLLGMVNYLSAKYYRRFDWTSAKLYTLSEKTVGVLGTVSKDVEVTLFMRPSEPLFEPVRELLERYQAASPRVHSRTVDPERNLLEAQRLSQRGVSSPNVVVFEAGEERRILDAVDLADFDYSGLQYGEQPRLTGLKAEQRFTGAILELLESRKPRILFTSGHGEISLEDASGRGLSRARSLLGRDNFDLEGWASLGKPAVPDGVDLIVVAGSTNPFTTAELAVLANYLERGGRLLALLDPEVGRADIGGDATFVRWLSGYGVEVGADVVVDFVGSRETLESGLAALRHGGRLVIIGLTAGAAPSFMASAVMRQEHEILGSRGFTRQEVIDTLELVARGRLRPVVNHTFSLTEANDANGLVTQEGNIGRVVLTMAG